MNYYSSYLFNVSGTVATTDDMPSGFFLLNKLGIFSASPIAPLIKPPPGSMPVTSFNGLAIVFHILLKKPLNFYQPVFFLTSPIPPPS